jgi:acetyl/propionyl-CoA carboxylase alpha subunit/acetyl-CoA carboxylase carboxyltransferase component
MFKRVAIVNRGEAAMRLIRAARELQFERGEPLVTIALYTDVERNAMFVREADEAVLIQSESKSAYLDHQVLEAALTSCRADAVWVGWGFVSEDPEFADLVERMGLVFIGPSGDVMRRLGDKIGAKHLAESAGVPVAAWSGGAVASVDEARTHAAAIGYPLMIKAAAGGGGRGIRRVTAAGELEGAFESARREAANAFGDDTLFMERVVTGGRHVEVQVVGDGQGGVWAVGVRDCSIQRRNQKVIEESASTALTAAAELRARSAAIALAEITGYRGAATVEFLYQPAEDLLAFLEVNTRLQVEHPVTEVTTGVDLVKLQLHTAAGGRLVGDPPPARGHAIEVRLNAEDPERGFAPAPGTVEHLVWASGPGLRIETGLAEGDVIPAEFDSMIAKVIGFGSDRDEARARVLRALQETTVVIRGGTTNKAFLAGLLEHPEVVAGEVDTTWLDRVLDEVLEDRSGLGAVALISSAIEAYDAIRAVERDRFFLSAARGRPQTDMELGELVELRIGGAAYAIEVLQIEVDRYRVVIDATRVDVHVVRDGPFERRLSIGSTQLRVVSISQGTETLVEVDGLPYRVTQDDAGLIRAPSPGLLVHVAVAAGDEVAPGALIATVESMKMEVALRAQVGGRVREVLAAVGAPVEAGSPLVRLETGSEVDGTLGDEGRVAFSALGSHDDGDHRQRVAKALDEMRAEFLGYDYPAREVERVLEAYRANRSELDPDDADTVRREMATLDAFADLVLLSRNRRIREDVAAEDVHSPREYFHAFLRTTDAARAGLPSSFEQKLLAALRHYGIDDLEWTPELAEALLWMFLAQQRHTAVLPVVLAILEFHLEHPGAPDELRVELLESIDRLILATQVRHPVVGALARSLRFRLFDEPLIEAQRSETLATMREQLGTLARTTDPAERAATMEVLVSCPLPLIRLMAVLDDGDMLERQELIEVQTRRYYETWSLADVRCFDRDGRRMVTGTFGEPAGRSLVVAAAAGGVEPDELHAVLASIGAEVGAEPSAVADVYVMGGTGFLPDGEDLAQRITGALGSVALPDGLWRVTVSVPVSSSHVSRFTFEREVDDFVENLTLRDLHPMIAERLRLWRLAEFSLRRLASADDVYLFEATSRSNRSDRRLLALAEVRDLTPLLGTTGSVAAYPALDQVLDSCLDGIRRAMADLDGSEPPQWNRIVLHVWPPVDLTQHELRSIVRSIAPRTEGIGLQQIDVQCKLTGPDGIEEVRMKMARSETTGLDVEVTSSPVAPMEPLSSYDLSVVRARQRGAIYPYEIIPLLLRTAGDAEREDESSGGSAPAFVEYDLDDALRAVPVDREYGQNDAGIVFGTVTTPTARYPEGMRRVVILGDPTKSLGSVSEPECRRIIGAIELAVELEAPIEWFAVSSGAKIAMDSGTENMDWVARVLRRLVEFTQSGGEVNVVVTGINVGAQPYWNAEATMLMHTKGILIMTPDSAMVLTGKQALEYSGGIGAEDNFGIGGYDRIMGPNGQAQYWAANLDDACRILMDHYEFAYVAPGERFGRRAPSTDPIERDVRVSPHHFEGTDFTTVGEIFAAETNAERKRAFDIRTVMRAVIDEDHRPLERWAQMADADTAVIFDAFLGGYPVTLVGIESRPVPRLGQLPPDGPTTWSGGTLFPMSSKKVARAINAASSNRPVVVLANLSGFDGSPESLRRLQLEYGAEIGRAMVNFEGPIIFCVISRYHGGAFVVFSGVLNDNLEVAAVDGSYASVIGGGPAAAVVFGGEVRKRTEADPRIVELRDSVGQLSGGRAIEVQAELAQLLPIVQAEKQAEVAAAFDQIHSIERAKAVGSVDTIVASRDLRPYLVGAVERGRERSERGS